MITFLGPGLPLHSSEMFPHVFNAAWRCLSFNVRCERDTTSIWNINLTLFKHKSNAVVTDVQYVLTFPHLLEPTYLRLQPSRSGMRSSQHCTSGHHRQLCRIHPCSRGAYASHT